jgi:hypothetical protein
LAPTRQNSQEIPFSFESPPPPPPQPHQLPYVDDRKESIHRLSLSQYKIIEINDEMVGEKIVRACNDFVYFGLIGDEATDVSTQEQVSVCVMFVECTNGKVIGIPFVFCMPQYIDYLLLNMFVSGNILFLLRR